MIRYYLHEGKYIEVSKCYKILFDFVKAIVIKLEKPDDITNPKVLDHYIKGKEGNNLNTLFENYVLYLSICPPEMETKNMFNEWSKNYKKDWDSNKETLFIVTKKWSDDIILISNSLFEQFLKYEIFKDEALLKLFRKYWIQHNWLILEKFYSAVTWERICKMSNVSFEEIEGEICDMVINNYIYAKINRIEKTVNFRKKTDHHDVLDDITYDMNKMLSGLETTCHLINKEYLKYGIKA